MSLRNKRVLITAGPTWVPIDSVRIISNIATGETGFLLAKRLVSLGAKVTLLLGPVYYCCLDKRVRVLRFKYFDELKDKIIQEIKSEKYNIVIHCAAVSDYKPRTVFKKKIKSSIKLWELRLKPTPKILNLIKKFDKNIFLVGFKFEPELAKGQLIKQARTLLKHSKSDLVIANTIYNAHYSAYIVSKEKVSAEVNSKNELSRGLIGEIGDALCKSPT